MKYQWNSNAHPISDVRDWNVDEKLEITPDYQRKEVWSEAAKIMLIDTILKDIPMPKIILDATIKQGRTYRKVIDGQQRLKAILAFLDDKIILDSPYEGPYFQKKYSELDEEVQNSILQYKIDINEIINAPEEVVREIYSRVNKYTIPLNKQELRKADFPGDFLKISESISLNAFLEDSKVFTVANRRRMGDVEYSSELLAAYLEGIQDKKNKLDDFYQKYSSMETSEMQRIGVGIQEIFEEMKKIFDLETFPIHKTRFKQKADFYSLFIAIKELKSEGGTLEGKDLRFLREDLKILDEYIMPESEIEILSEYAIKCVSQSNTIGSRTWRKNFLKNILVGTYLNLSPDETLIKGIVSFLNKSQIASEDLFIQWEEECKYFHISNAKLISNE